VNPGAGKHTHQGVDTEEIDPSSNEIADPRLRDTEQLSGLALGERAFLDEFPYFDHERRAKPKMLSLILVKAEVGEHITA
jgi:hypothetical protein